MCAGGLDNFKSTCGEIRRLARPCSCAGCEGRIRQVRQGRWRTAGERSGNRGLGHVKMTHSAIARVEIVAACERGGETADREQLRARLVEGAVDVGDCLGGQRDQNRRLAGVSDTEPYKLPWRRSSRTAVAVARSRRVDVAVVLQRVQIATEVMELEDSDLSDGKGKQASNRQSRGSNVFTAKLAGERGQVEHQIARTIGVGIELDRIEDLAEMTAGRANDGHAAKGDAVSSGGTCIVHSTGQSKRKL